MISFPSLELFLSLKIRSSSAYRTHLFYSVNCWSDIFWSYSREWRFNIKIIICFWSWFHYFILSIRISWKLRLSSHVVLPWFCGTWTFIFIHSSYSFHFMTILKLFSFLLLKNLYSFSSFVESILASGNLDKSSSGASFCFLWPI